MNLVRHMDCRPCADAVGVNLCVPNVSPFSVSKDTCRDGWARLRSTTSNLAERKLKARQPGPPRAAAGGPCHGSRGCQPPWHEGGDVRSCRYKDK